ncbi:hypothetical protein CPB85DRAFT_750346 [Mucidula mucida]|nr:hypothetical protein CPB85DRAFT_750346 [Mucidula mucida]
MKWLRHLFARGIASCSFKSSASSANTAQLIMSLPQEILDLIIDYVALLPPRYKTLEACALTCRSFYPRTLTCRFRHVNITGRNNIAPFINAMASTRLSHVQPLVTSISITFPLKPRDLHLILPSVIRVLTNVRSLHIQNVEWDAISPDLRTALAAHSYVSVRLTGIRFTTVSQLLELLSTSPKLQRLSLSGTVFDTSPCRYSSSNIEVDCLEINHQDHDVSDSISCLYRSPSTAFESSRFACCHIDISASLRVLAMELFASKLSFTLPEVSSPVCVIS